MVTGVSTSRQFVSWSESESRNRAKEPGSNGDNDGDDGDADGDEGDLVVPEGAGYDQLGNRLQLADCRLRSVLVPDFVSRTGWQHALLTINLHNNRISDISPMQLRVVTPALTDLDISNNSLKGSIPSNLLPTSLMQLNLSHNKIVDLPNIVELIHLKALDLSNNLMKKIVGLPPAVERLNIADNLLATPQTLRALSIFSHHIQSITVAGNPFVEAVRDWRVRLVSTLPDLTDIDGAVLPGCRIRKSRATQQPPSPPKRQVPAVSRKEQQELDRKRWEVHDFKRKTLDICRQTQKEQMRESMVGGRKVLRAHEVQALAARLLKPKNNATLLQNKNPNLQMPAWRDASAQPSKGESIRGDSVLCIILLCLLRCCYACSIFIR